MATIQEREFYTVSEAARRLDVSRTTVWRWINDGRLRAFRIGGGTIRIRRQDVEGMMRPAGRETRKQDIWADYDPERARQAFRQARGILAGIDREKFLREMHEARGQDSRGRPSG
jgi:excisionase family DNA binding protein